MMLLGCAEISSLVIHNVLIMKRETDDISAKLINQTKSQQLLLLLFPLLREAPESSTQPSKWKEKSQQNLSNADQLRSGSITGISNDIGKTTEFHQGSHLYECLASYSDIFDGTHWPACIFVLHSLIKQSHTELHRSVFTDKLIDFCLWHRGKENNGFWGPAPPLPPFWFHTEASPMLLISHDL